MDTNEQATAPKPTPARNGEPVTVYLMPPTKARLQALATKQGQKGIAPLVRAAIAAYLQANEGR